MKMLRVFFSKTGRAKYISHLDLARCLTRAFARTDIPAWFTEGFNPHLYVTFALPLPLGFTSREESFDFRVLEDDYPPEQAAEKLGAVLPEGIRVLRAAPPVDDPSAITWADYDIILAPRGDGAEELAGALAAFLDRPEILAEKKTKHRTHTVDLRPLLRVLSLGVEEDRVRLLLRLAAGGTANINPNLLLDAFSAAGGPAIDSQWIDRVAIRKEDLKVFH